MKSFKCTTVRLREREKRKTLVISLPMQARFFSHSLESYSHFVIITFSYCFTCCNARTLVFVAMCTAKKSLWETENKIDLRHKKYYVWPFSSILFFFFLERGKYTLGLAWRVRQQGSSEIVSAKTEGESKGSGEKLHLFISISDAFWEKVGVPFRNRTRTDFVQRSWNRPVCQIRRIRNW